MPPLPIPADDILCRFVRPRDWSVRDQRLRPGAFKDNRGLSLGHTERLRQHSVALESLLIDNLAGYGQAHHTAGDYLRFALEAAERESQPLSLQVEWRPEDEYVAEAWRQWAYAHVQVETETDAGAEEVLIEFRRLLAMNARWSTPPAQYSQD